jgi:hypothetical protein
VSKPEKESQPLPPSLAVIEKEEQRSSIEVAHECLLVGESFVVPDLPRPGPLMPEEQWRAEALLMLDEQWTTEALSTCAIHCQV